MNKLVLSGAVAIAALAFSSAAVLAAPNAVVLQDSPVFQTKTGMAVVNQVEEDDLVEVTECGTTRCRVKIPGPDGWVRKNRLAPLDDEGDPQPSLPFSLGITMGPGGPGLSIGIGGGSGGISIDAGTGATSGPRVCLYQNAGYGGAMRCFAAGDTVNNLTSVGWNDVARSLKTFGGAEAQICEHANFNGACATYSGNTPNLGGMNAKASSIDVY